MSGNFNDLDEQMRLLVERVRESKDDSPWVVCQDRYREYVSSIKAIKDSVNAKNTHVSIEQEGQYMSIGNIVILGKEIVPVNSQKFAEALSTASNVHIFPRTDGLVECDITYYGLTRKI